MAYSKIYIPAYPLSAVLMGGIGAAVFGALAHNRFGIEIPRIFEIIAWSQLVGLSILIFVVRLERVHWVKKRILVHWSVTWAIMLGLLTLAYRALFPEMRDWQVFKTLAFPLWFTNWWIAPIFGVVQDRWVKWDARRAKAAQQAQRPQS